MLETGGGRLREIGVLSKLDFIVWADRPKICTKTEILCQFLRISSPCSSQQTLKRAFSALSTTSWELARALNSQDLWFKTTSTTCHTRCLLKTIHTCHSRPTLRPRGETSRHFREISLKNTCHRTMTNKWTTEFQTPLDSMARALVSWLWNKFRRFQLSQRRKTRRSVAGKQKPRLSKGKFLLDFLTIFSLVLSPKKASAPLKNTSTSTMSTSKRTWTRMLMESTSLSSQARSSSTSRIKS